ncbi:hypothetical protein C8Q79DRAFT_1013325 [Trametes meyenii]|nr:hypothetical protein C8Q79DRAFT_1013325 [Trametes meyenii]
MDIESVPEPIIAPIDPIFPASEPVALSTAAAEVIRPSRGHRSPTFLGIPTSAHRRSRESLVSATTLVPGSEPHDNNDNLQSSLYTDRPLTAEPATQTGDSESRRWVMGPMPVSYFVRNRYTKRFNLSAHPDLNEKEIKKIPALNGLPDRPQKLSRGWERFVHPEGQVYFRYQNFFTNSYLYDKERLSDVDYAVDLLQDLIDQHKGRLPAQIEVGVDVYVNETNKYACYYVCNMVREEVFWFDEVDIDFLVEEDTPVFHTEHLKHAHAIHFWNHIHMFPQNRTFAEARLKEIHAMLTYYLYGERVLDYDMAKIARMKSFTANEIFLNYHGTQWARLDANRSVRYDITTRVHSWWFKPASWTLFCTPMVYVRRLDEMWIDGKINHQPWRKFIAEIQEDWTASITPSTVILTANVGFLAIQSVDQNGEANPDRSAAQIVSYISTLLSVGNIIACTVLARQHRPTSYYHAEDAYDYLAERASTLQRAELLAVVLSIPAAFFIWGLTAFCVAIMWVCLYDTSLMTRVCVLSATAFTAALLVPVVKNGEWAPPKMVHSIPAQMKQKLRKIPVRRLTQQVRKMSMPLRKISSKLKKQSESHDEADIEMQTTIN